MRHEDRTIIRKYPSGGFIPVDRAYVSEPQTPLLEGLFDYLAEAFSLPGRCLGHGHPDNEKHDYRDGQKISKKGFQQFHLLSCEEFDVRKVNNSGENR